MHDNIKVIVTDIEGTTTPISFVKAVLFPYVLKNLPETLEREWGAPEFMGYIVELRKQSIEDAKAGLADAVEIPDLEINPEAAKIAVIENISWQMRQDRKIGSLKNLQGYLWKKGYASGELKSYCYPDVQEAFKRWGSKSVPVYIYSSGSIAAQKLLFEHTESGDLTTYLSGYFDTITAGPKNLPQSYSKIASELGYSENGSEILFLTDSFVEAEAANVAGLSTILLLRPHNPPIDDEDLSKHESRTTFESIL